MNASPISMGLLSSRGPPAWHPASETLRSKCEEAAEFCQVCDTKIITRFLRSSYDIIINLKSGLK